MIFTWHFTSEEINIFGMITWQKVAEVTNSEILVVRQPGQLCYKRMSQHFASIHKLKSITCYSFVFIE